MNNQKAVSKSKGVTPMSFRLPSALVDEARAVAAADGVTLTWFLVLAMEERLSRRVTVKAHSKRRAATAAKAARK